MRTLTVKLAPSRMQWVYLLTVHSLAFISVWLAELRGFMTVCFWSLVALSLYWQWLRYGKSQSAWFIQRVTCFEDGAWEIIWGNGVSQSARLLESYAHRCILILYFTANSWLRPTVMVLSDSAERDDIRRLRGLLRTLRD